MPIDLMRPLESAETVLDDAGHERHFVHHGPLLRRVLNPIAVALGTDAVLFVRGRTSGMRLAVPMDPPFEWEGVRYLVSPLGETHWARNVRAAGEGEIRVRGQTERFRAVELTRAEHDRILDAYARTITCGCQAYLHKLPDPADHPVFRLEPADVAP
jgi:hypothetical protein